MWKIGQRSVGSIGLRVLLSKRLFDGWDQPQYGASGVGV